MARKIDQPHILTVLDAGDEKDYELAHDGCGHACAWWPGRADDLALVPDDLPAGWDFEAEQNAYEATHGHPTCYVAWEVGNAGLDSLDIHAVSEDTGGAHLDDTPVGRFGLDEWRRLRPGRYVVVGWYHPGVSTPNGPAEPDGGIYIDSWESEEVTA